MNRFISNALITSESELSIPAIPGYTIKSVLGIGGFSTVYLAVQHTLQRDVALKVMDPALIDRSENYSARFLREARDTAVVSNHPNIVTIFDVGCAAQFHYIAMQHLSGANLKQQIDSGQAIAKPEVLIFQVAEALSAVHEKGFIHRDIKPANILFDDAGNAILSDFGVARRGNTETTITQAKSIVGTARYMSPEQGCGQSVDARADLYSLGIVFFEILAGYPPYNSTDAMALMFSHAHGPVPALPEERKYYQPLLDKLLAKKAEQRFASARDLMDALQQLAGSSAQGLVAHSNKEVTPNFQRSTASNNTSSAFVIAAALATITVLGMSVLFLKQNTDTTLPELALHCPTLTEQQMQKKAELVELAEMQVAMGRASFPPTSNALEAYREALKLDPCNQTIIDAIAQIRSMPTVAETTDL